MKNIKTIINKIYLLCLLLLFSHNSYATFLDTDTYCTNYGCAMICDNNACNVYDVYIIATGGTVGVGGQLMYYTTNPVVGTGAGPTQANYRNSFTKTAVNPANSGARISIVNPTSGGVVTDGGSAGFLDAGDTISSFGLSNTTNISWVATAADPTIASTGTNPLRHTMFFCSRGVNVNIRAQITTDTSFGEYNTNVTNANIGYNISATRTGTEAGVVYGNTSRNPAPFVSAGLTNISTFGAVTTVGWFTNSTRNANTTGTNVAAQMRQCNKIEMEYTFPNAGLHLGQGAKNYNIAYTFWRR